MPELMAEAVFLINTDGRVSFTYAMPKLMAEAVFSMSILPIIIHICDA